MARIVVLIIGEIEGILSVKEGSSGLPRGTSRSITTCLRSTRTKPRLLRLLKLRYTCMMKILQIVLLYHHIIVLCVNWYEKRIGTFLSLSEGKMAGGSSGMPRMKLGSLGSICGREGRGMCSTASLS